MRRCRRDEGRAAVTAAAARGWASPRGGAARSRALADAADDAAVGAVIAALVAVACAALRLGVVAVEAAPAAGLACVLLPMPTSSVSEKGSTSVLDEMTSSCVMGSVRQLFFLVLQPTPYRTAVVALSSF